ncbi:MAG: RDD family protein, partial [Frankiaceae bacterium]|nr:RDD family protein [Frankiaceae bacterium]
MQADDQVITGEAVVIDLRLAGVGSRGIAALIDMLVSYAALFVLVFVMAAFDFGSVSAIITFLLVSVVLVLV